MLGDFDSIKPEVMDYYKNLNVPSLKFNSQDETDFEKSLMFLLERQYFQNPEKIWQITAIGGIGGRIDQTIQNLSLLVKYSEILKQRSQKFHFFIINNSSLVTCMLPGKTKYIRNRQLEHENGVGIVPIMGQTKVRTFGFKWDLSFLQQQQLYICKDEKFDGELEMGNYISSNNEFNQDEVYIETNQPVIFTTKIIKF